MRKIPSKTCLFQIRYILGERKVIAIRTIGFLPSFKKDRKRRKGILSLRSEIAQLRNINLRKVSPGNISMQSTVGFSICEKFNHRKDTVGAEMFLNTREWQNEKSNVNDGLSS